MKPTDLSAGAVTIGVISGYNDGSILEGCLESLLPVCQKFVYVDGSYSRYPLIRNNHLSTDISIDVAKSFGATIIMPKNGPWISQVAKRNAYLCGGSGDWYLMLDTDERFVGDLSKADLDKEYAYKIPLRNEGTSHFRYLVRFFKQIDGLRYFGANEILFHGGRMLTAYDSTVLDGCRIDHFPSLKSQERQKANAEYYPIQLDMEKDFREHYQCP